MKIYHYDHSGVFVASSDADESPLEPGVFLIPAFATSVEPPAFGEGECAVFDGETWRVESIPVPPVEPPPPEGPPPSVTMRQARQALVLRGLYATVNNAIATIPGSEGDLARIEWEFSQVVERNRPLTHSMIALLGMTEAQADELFQFAATL